MNNFEDLTVVIVTFKTNKKSFVGHVYSGMSIIKQKVLKENFRHKKNFEKEFYPLVIKKYNSEDLTDNGKAQLASLHFH